MKVIEGLFERVARPGGRDRGATPRRVRGGAVAVLGARLRLPAVVVATVALAYGLLVVLTAPQRASATPNAPTFLGEILETEVPGGLSRVNDAAADAGSGDVYLTQENRVVKLTPYGQFVLAFGREVNRTKVEAVEAKQAKGETPTTGELEEENVCTAASGNDCVAEGRFGEAGGQFVQASGVAVQPGTGDVFVEDRFNDRVEKFDSSGHFLLTFGREVNKAKTEAVKAKEAKGETPTAAELAGEGRCVAGEACQAGKTGTGEGQFTLWPANANAVAVGGAAGKELLYVGDKARIEVFNTNGEYQEALSLASLSSTGTPSAIAADGSGNVFFVDGGVAGVHKAETNAGKLELSGTLYDASSTHIEAIAASASGGLYVADSSPSFQVLLYKASSPAEAPAEFASGEPGRITEAKGIAVDAGDGVYVPNATRLDFYGSVSAIEAHYGAPPLLKPTLSGERTTATVDETTATLEAEIDPQLRETTYQFEYGPEPCGAGTCTTVSVAPAPLGTITKTNHQVAVPIGGLQTAHNYYYRLTATNSAGASQSEKRFSIAQSSQAGSPGIPDGRVYELISPALKPATEAGFHVKGQEGEGEAGDGFPYMVVGANGDEAAYSTNGPVGEAASGFSFFSVARRSDEGWLSHTAMPSVAAGFESFESSRPEEAMLFASDMKAVVFGTPGIYAAEQERFSQTPRLYRYSEDGQLQWIGKPQISEPQMLPAQGKGNVAGASPDLSTVYFTFPGIIAQQDEEPNPAFGGVSRAERFRADVRASKEGKFKGYNRGFYEWHNGSLEYAGVLPNGQIDPDGAVPAALLPVWREDHNRHSVSEDGRTAFFLSPDPLSASGRPSELYVRETLSDGSHKTLLVSRDLLLPESGGLPAGAPESVTFEYAAPDGSRAFFESNAQLTPEAQNDGKPKEYEFNTQTGTLTYLAGVAPESYEGNLAEPEDVRAIVASSRDASNFMFFRKGELEYWNEGVITDIGPTGLHYYRPPTSSVAMVVHADPSGSAYAIQIKAAFSEFHFNNGNGAYAEVYRYQPAGNQLTCVSCPPKGTAPTGPAFLSHAFGSGNWGGTTHGITPGNRGISDDGSRVFFDTPDALVKQDTNGVRDVYEWQNGTVDLISTGVSTEPSIFGDNTPSGNDVIFATAESLVPGDTDGGYDVYDARVPRPGDQPPPSAVPCEGAVCQGPPSVPNLLGAPSSETFNGSGNPMPSATAVAERKQSGVPGSQQLRDALQACVRKHRHSPGKRRACERTAHKRYGAKAARRASARQRGARGHSGFGNRRGEQ